MQGQTRVGQIECPNCGSLQVRTTSGRVDPSTGRPYLPKGMAWLIAFVLTAFAGGLIGAAVAGELHSGPLGAIPASVPALVLLVLAGLFIARASRAALDREVDRCVTCGPVWTPGEPPGASHDGGVVSLPPRGWRGSRRASSRRRPGSR